MSTGETPRLWRHIFGSREGYLCTFSGLRTSNASPLQQREERFFTYPTKAEAASAWLTKQAREGREAYFCAHLLTMPRRRKDAAAHLQALYVDGDRTEIPDGIPAPSAVVESSPGRKQFWWRLTRPVSSQKGEELNKRLAYAMEADKSGWDLTQLLRAPGTVNHKYSDTPMVKLLEARDLAYDPDELDRLLAPLPEKKPEDRRRRYQGRTPPPLSADEVEKRIGLAHRSKRGEEFCKLHDRGDATGYKSRSEAHMALFGQYAFWFNRDTETMVQVFKRSTLWANSGRDEEYAQRTAETAASNCTKVYSPGPDLACATENARASLRRFALETPWDWRGGPTDFAIFWTSINTEGGRLCEEGLIVAPGTERLSIGTGGTRPNTVSDSTARLEKRGFWRRLDRSNGRHAERFLIPIPAQTRYIDIKLSPCVTSCITGLCCIGDAAPQTYKAFDKNGRRIPRGASSYLKNPLGRLVALTVAKAIAYGGLSDCELAQSMGRRAGSLRERCIAPAIEAGLLVQDGSTNVPPADLLERIERELEETGCTEREKLRRARFEIQRKRWNEERTTFLYGEPPEETNEAETLALKAQGEKERHIDVEGLVSELEREPKEENSTAVYGVVPGPKDPERFRELAALARERIAEHRRKHPPPPQSGPERAALLLRRLHRDDPECFAALRSDPRALAWEISGRGWTETIYCGNTIRSALEAVDRDLVPAGAVA
jgi:hypothetical protein